MLEAYESLMRSFTIKEERRIDACIKEDSMHMWCDVMWCDVQVWRYLHCIIDIAQIETLIEFLNSPYHAFFLSSHSIQSHTCTRTEREKERQHSILVEAERLKKFFAEYDDDIHDAKYYRYHVTHRLSLVEIFTMKFAPLESTILINPFDLPRYRLFWLI